MSADALARDTANTAASRLQGEIEAGRLHAPWSVWPHSQGESIELQPGREGLNKGREGLDKSRLLSDAIIGLSDGMTVPFALTAGLSFTGSSRTVVLGGLAELIAGTISMGLGGYLGNKSERDTFRATSRKVTEIASSDPMQASELLRNCLRDLSVSDQDSSAIAKLLAGSTDAQRKLLLLLHYKEMEPSSLRPFISATTIGAGYLLGGTIPLIPYLCTSNVQHALYTSLGVMEMALLLFGWTKTGLARGAWAKGPDIRACAVGALEMVCIGSIATGVAMGVGYGLNKGL